MVLDPQQISLIVAIATPPGVGAIGVIRLSGPGALSAVGSLWVNKDVTVDKIESRRIYYGNIVDFSTEDVVDEVLLAYFRGPKSFTGEDVVELHCHGNQIILEKIVQLCVSVGARVAEPGEFTRRAYMNGRIDLAQAEAVADVIVATSAEGVRRAQEQLRGRLSIEVRKEISALTAIRAFVEASIDFPEEDIALLKRDDTASKILAMCQRLEGLSASYQEGRLYREGARVVLVGPPNAGKSSLFNRFLGEPRALVHQVAGTTRDTIEESAVWNGVAVTLVDTAGLRALTSTVPHEEIEALGIMRTRETLTSADLCLLVTDGQRDIAKDECEQLLALPRDRVVIFRNKSDLGLQAFAKNLRSIFPQHTPVCGSATTGEGVHTLKNELLRLLGVKPSGDRDGASINSMRHKVAVDDAVVALRLAYEELQQFASVEFVAEYLSVASQALGQIVGVVATEDLLGEIFSQFCIGK